MLFRFKPAAWWVHWVFPLVLRLWKTVTKPFISRPFVIWLTSFLPPSADFSQAGESWLVECLLVWKAFYTSIAFVSLLLPGAALSRMDKRGPTAVSIQGSDTHWIYRDIKQLFCFILSCFPISSQYGLCHFDCCWEWADVFKRISVVTPTSPVTRWQWDSPAWWQLQWSLSLDVSLARDVLHGCFSQALHEFFDSEFHLPVYYDILLQLF